MKLLILLATMAAGCGYAVDYVQLSPKKSTAPAHETLIDDKPTRPHVMIGHIEVRKRNILCSMPGTISEIRDEAERRGADGVSVSCARPGTVAFENCACAGDFFVYLHGNGVAVE